MQVKVVGGRSEMPSQNKQSPCCLTRSVHKAKVGQLGSRYVPLFWTIQKAVFIPPEIKAAMGGSSFHHVQSGLLSGIHCMLSCQGHTELDTKQGGGGGGTPCLKSQSVHMEAACGKSRERSSGSHTSLCLCGHQDLSLKDCTSFPGQISMCWLYTQHAWTRVSLAEPFKAVASSLRLTRSLTPHQCSPNTPPLLDRVGFCQGTCSPLEHPDPSLSLFMISNNQELVLGLVNK